MKPLGHGMDVNTQHTGKLARMALMLAAASGLEDAVGRLLQWPNIWVNAQDSKGQTALNLAVFQGHGTIVKKFLDHNDI